MGNKNSGRRPLPSTLKLLRGMPRARINPAEPTPPPGKIRPPHLSRPARRVWQRMAPICQTMGTLTPADVLMFAGYCELEATRAAIRRTKGTPKFNPLLELAIAREIRPYAALFGLEPVSRARIHVPPKQPISKWADAL